MVSRRRTHRSSRWLPLRGRSCLSWSASWRWLGPCWGRNRWLTSFLTRRPCLLGWPGLGHSSLWLGTISGFWLLHGFRSWCCLRPGCLRPCIFLGAPWLLVAGRRIGAWTVSFRIGFLSLNLSGCLGLSFEALHVLTFVLAA